MMQRGMKKEVSKQGQIISREKNLIWENSNGNFKKVVGRTQCLKNHRKNRIQHCERSEQRLHFEWPKSS